MDTIPTNFHKPDFNLDYEGTEPPNRIPGKKPIVTPNTVVCCTCSPTNTSVCATENDTANFVGSTVGYVGAYWFM